MRLRFRKPAIVMAVFCGLWPLVGAAPVFLRMVRSEPVVVNQVDFRAATQDRWFVYNPPHGQDKVDIRLEITNLADAPLLFPTFDTFRLALQMPDGKEVPMSGGRDGTLRGAVPVLISPRETYSLCRPAHLTWTTDGKARRLTYFDGTGSEFSFGPLATGKYSLRFTYENKNQQVIDGHSSWIGDAQTGKVEFEIVPNAP